MKEEMHEISKKKAERMPAEMEKEDFLLHQIDEFREKAKQLQKLMRLKESKAKELQSLVNERQDKAEELEQLLNERQEEADQLVKDFNQRLKELSVKVTNQMTEMETSISYQVTQAKNASEAQLEANRKLNEEQLEANRKLNEEQLETNRRLNEEQLEKSKQFLEEQVMANKKLNESQIAEVKELLDTTATRLDSVKTDLSEKVHKENVKYYRNIQDLFKEFDSRMEKMNDMEKGLGSVRGYVKCLTWFSILNFVVLIGFLLYSLGIFSF